MCVYIYIYIYVYTHSFYKPNTRATACNTFHNHLVTSSDVSSGAQACWNITWHLSGNMDQGWISDLSAVYWAVVLPRTYISGPAAGQVPILKIYIYICLYIYIYLCITRNVTWYNTIWYNIILYTIIQYNMHTHIHTHIHKYMCIYVCVHIIYYNTI